MAKDGTMRGGARVGAGKKPKALHQKINEGSADGALILPQPVELEGAGFDCLVTGGAYALLRPVFVEPFLPDRPEAPSCGFEEALMAVREAEPIIADVPEFVPWCQGHEWLVASARAFAERDGLDW